MSGKDGLVVAREQEEDEGLRGAGFLRGRGEEAVWERNLVVEERGLSSVVAYVLECGGGGGKYGAGPVSHGKVAPYCWSIWGLHTHTHTNTQRARTWTENEVFQSLRQ